MKQTNKIKTSRAYLKTKHKSHLVRSVTRLRQSLGFALTQVFGPGVEKPVALTSAKSTPQLLASETEAEKTPSK